MCYSNDQDSVCFYGVDKAKRKAMKKHSPQASSDLLADRRLSTEYVNSTMNVGQKINAEIR